MQVGPAIALMFNFMLERYEWMLAKYENGIGINGKYYKIPIADDIVLLDSNEE